MLSLLLEGAVLGISIAAPLGPVNIQQIRQGLAGGFWPAFLVSLGAATADTFYFSLVAFGLAPLVFRYPMIKTVLWLAGTVLLMRLGLGSLRGACQLDLSSPGKGVATRTAAYLSGLCICLANPMTIVLWTSVGTAAFASTGLAAEPGFHRPLFSLYAGVLCGLLGWGGSFSLFLAWGRRWVTPAVLGVVNRICGLALLGFAGYFGWQAVKSLGI